MRVVTDHAGEVGVPAARPHFRPLMIAHDEPIGRRDGCLVVRIAGMAGNARVDAAIDVDFAGVRIGRMHRTRSVADLTSDALLLPRPVDAGQAVLMIAVVARIDHMAAEALVGVGRRVRRARHVSGEAPRCPHRRVVQQPLRIDAGDAVRENIPVLVHEVRTERVASDDIGDLVPRESIGRIGNAGERSSRMILRCLVPDTQQRVVMPMGACDIAQIGVTGVAAWTADVAGAVIGWVGGVLKENDRCCLNLDRAAVCAGQAGKKRHGDKQNQPDNTVS